MFLSSVKPSMPETTALGAAMAAGAAEGVSVWSLNPKDLSEVTSEKSEPQINTEGTASPVLLHPASARPAGLTEPVCVCRERVPLRSLEEGGAEVHELGDDRTRLPWQRYAAPRPPSLPQSFAAHVETAVMRSRSAVRVGKTQF